jgi:hypothetical protein
MESIEIGKLSCINPAFHHNRFLSLLETNMPHMLLASSLDGSASLPCMNVTALTKDVVDTGDLQIWFVLTSLCI